MALERVVLLPGFGDPLVGTAWAHELTDLLGPVPAVVLDWPGMWSRSSEPVSFSGLLAEARELAGPGTAFVGHSLGGLVGLQVAAELEAEAVVTICSPRELIFATGAPAAAWRASGARRTVRTGPDGMSSAFDLPVTFLDEILTELNVGVLPPAPTLMIFGADDDQVSASPEAWAPSAGRRQSIVVGRCAHRFMVDPSSRSAVLTAAARFLTS